ncbi:PAS domain S-box protein [Desulfomarina sp.]
MSAECAHGALAKRNRELERQLLEMKKFQQAFFYGSDGMAIADDGGTLLEVNHALCEMFGYSREELLGKPCVTFKDWSENEEFQRRYALLFQQGYLNVETEYLHKDGRVIPVELNASVFRYDNRYLVQISIRDISYRREKENLIKRQREICSATDDLMSFVDRDYVYRFVNRAYLDTFKITLQDVLGRRVDDLLGREIFEKHVRKRLDQCFSGETVRFQGQFSIPAHKGERYLDITFYPYREPGGVLSGAIVVIHDVTDIKLVERCRVQEGKRYQHILSNVSDGVFIVDDEYNIIHANATLQKSFGKVRPGRKCFEYLNRAQSPCFWCNNTHVLRGNTARWQMNVVGKNQVYEVYETPFELSEGKTIKVSFFREITEQYLAEKKLAEKNEQLQILIDASPDLICFKDEEGRWLLANQAILDLYGVSLEDLAGKKDNELPWSSPFREDIFRKGEKSWQPGTVFRNDQVVVLPDGEVKIYDVLEVPLFDGGGESKGFIGLGRDITERVRAEEKLREEMEGHRLALRQLAEKNEEIKNTNIALNVLLNKAGNDGRSTRKKAMADLKRVILPYLDLLGEYMKGETGHEYITIVKSHLSSFSDSHAGLPRYSDFGLTKREILVADLIRNGKKSKEIASLLGLSPRSIEAYRNSLRKKLHLTGKKVRLNHYLNSTFFVGK